MKFKSGLLLLSAALLAGCASASRSDPHYVATEQNVELVTAHAISHVPRLIETDSTIEGEHPLGFYLQSAFDRNPGIQAAQRSIAAASEVIPQVTSLDDPVLMDSFQPFSNYGLQTAAGRAPNMLSLNQKFPWYGKLALRGEVAQQDVQMALARAAEAQLKVTEEVRLAYFELQFNQRAIAISEEDTQLLTDLLKIAEARYRTGAASQQDVLRAQVELDRISERLIGLRRQMQQSQADLAGVLHVSPESKLLASSELETLSAPEEIAQLYEAAARCRPELQERFHAMIKSQKSRDLAELQYCPDVTLGLGWQAVTASDAVSRVASGNDNVALTVGVNLPIWRDKLESGVREWEQRSLENARRYEATLDDTFRMIRRLTVQLDAQQQQLDLFRGSMIPKTEQALRISTNDYRVGKVDFQQLLDNWSDLLMFRLQVARLEASQSQTLASLERVVGCELATATTPALAPVRDSDPNPDPDPDLPRE